MVPALRACAGFVAQIFLADRTCGTLIGTSYWVTEADMVASEARAGRPASELQKPPPPKSRPTSGSTRCPCTSSSDGIRLRASLIGRG